MSFNIKPIDPLVKDFYADDTMHDILVTKDIQLYLDYVYNKYKSIKKEEKIQEINQQEIKEEVIYDSNNYKKQMLECIWANIMILEDTINKFK
jgi:hypothetical protein